MLKQEAGGTRLHVRERYQFARRKDRLTYNLVVIASCIMTRKMLLTIKALAEG